MQCPCQHRQSMVPSTCVMQTPNYHQQVSLPCPPLTPLVTQNKPPAVPTQISVSTAVHESYSSCRLLHAPVPTQPIPCRRMYRFPHRFGHTCTTFSTLSPLPTCPMHMYRQPQQMNTRGSCRKAALGTGWRWWLHTLNRFRNCFDGSSIEHQCLSTSTLTWYHPKFSSRLVVCCQRSWPHSPPAWIVLRPVFPGTRHWKGLTSTGVTVPYTALTLVQDYRLVLLLNSVQGQHY